MRVFDDGAYADRAFDAQARGLDARDRALAMRLAYGAVQRKGTLDHFVETLAERPVARLGPPVRAALRLGLYELLYTHGAPDRAVVSEAVELAKGRGGASLVNAVLRRASREGRATLLGLDDREPASAALAHSHPRWIAETFWAALGADGARALMAADNEPAELAVRANTLRTSTSALAAALPVPTRRDPGLPEALVLEGPLALRGSRPFRAGELVAQSRAAMLVAHALAPQPGERVLDLCAAPGGKTTHVAALMEGRGEVVAVERHRGRAHALERTVERCGAHNVRVVVADARGVAAGAGPVGRRAARGFDRVLVDPPCSGLGTLQGHPDLRWRMTPERAAALAVRQREILAAGAAALRPGGVLVYSTCTISPLENERLIAAFVRAHEGLALVDLTAAWPALASGAALAAPQGEAGVAAVVRAALLTLPHRDHTAGFFISALRRG